jgi:hypothetical protein
LGQLAVMRHLISGIDWAIAGAAMVAAPATPNPVTLIKSRRFMISPSCGDCASLRFEAWHQAWNIWFPISIPPKCKKPGLVKRPGFWSTT